MPRKAWLFGPKLGETGNYYGVEDPVELPWRGSLSKLAGAPGPPVKVVKVCSSKCGRLPGPPPSNRSKWERCPAPPCESGCARAERTRARAPADRDSVGSERASSTKREPHAGEAERHMRARSKSACHDAPMGAPRPRPTGTAVPRPAAEGPGARPPVKAVKVGAPRGPPRQSWADLRAPCQSCQSRSKLEPGAGPPSKLGRSPGPTIPLCTAGEPRARGPLALPHGAGRGELDLRLARLGDAHALVAVERQLREAWQPRKLVRGHLVGRACKSLSDGISDVASRTSAAPIGTLRTTTSPSGSLDSTTPRTCRPAGWRAAAPTAGTLR